MRIDGVGKPEGCKLIRFSADIEGDTLNRIRIRGDFFASPEAGFDRVEERLAGIPLSELEGCFNTLLQEEEVEAFGITGSGISSLVYASLKSAFPNREEKL
ncbi:MAG: hypothetical protein LBF74_09135 [Treponema sp.]|jgi:hypothetical protein|nr:hypothetical protein [Treponema sp.]